METQQPAARATVYTPPPSPAPIDKLNTAFAEAQAKFPVIPKNKTAKVTMKAGGQYSYKYADLADVLTAVLPILGAHGLSVRQPIKTNASGMRIFTQLHHASGQWTQDDGLPIPANLPPQELGSALTYMRRYGVCALLGVAPDEDEDGALANQAAKDQQELQRAQNRTAQAEARHQQQRPSGGQQTKPNAQQRNSTQAKGTATQQELKAPPGSDQLPSDEEMRGARVGDVQLSGSQRAQFWEAAKQGGHTKTEVITYVKERFNTENSATIPAKHFKEIMAWAMKPAGPPPGPGPEEAHAREAFGIMGFDLNEQIDVIERFTDSDGVVDWKSIGEEMHGRIEARDATRE